MTNSLINCMVVCVRCALDMKHGVHHRTCILFQPFIYSVLLFGYANTCSMVQNMRPGPYNKYLNVIRQTCTKDHLSMAAIWLASFIGCMCAMRFDANAFALHGHHVHTLVFNEGRHKIDETKLP